MESIYFYPMTIWIKAEKRIIIISLQFLSGILNFFIKCGYKTGLDIGWKSMKLFRETERTSLWTIDYRFQLYVVFWYFQKESNQLHSSADKNAFKNIFISLLMHTNNKQRQKKMHVSKTTMSICILIIFEKHVLFPSFFVNDLMSDVRIWLNEAKCSSNRKAASGQIVRCQKRNLSNRNRFHYRFLSASQIRHYIV